MTIENAYTSKVTVNAKQLNSPIKRHRVEGWIKTLFSGNTRQLQG